MLKIQSNTLKTVVIPHQENTRVNTVVDIILVINSMMYVIVILKMNTLHNIV